MNYVRFLGCIVFVVGIILLVLGINATQQFGQEVSEKITGHYGEQTKTYIILGSVLIVGGLILVRNRRIKK